jgi:hypothetical protein
MDIHPPLLHWLSASLHRQHGVQAVRVVETALAEGARHTRAQWGVLSAVATTLRRASKGCGGFVDVVV